jgi:hypothetical protein
MVALTPALDDLRARQLRTSTRPLVPDEAQALASAHSRALAHPLLGRQVAAGGDARMLYRSRGARVVLSMETAEASLRTDVTSVSPQLVR